MTTIPWIERKPVTAPEQRLQLEQVPSSQFHAEVIPDEELPIDCESSFPDRPCYGMALVWITSDSNSKRRALCGVCAHYAFAKWLTEF